VMVVHSSGNPDGWYRSFCPPAKVIKAKAKIVTMHFVRVEQKRHFIWSGFYIFIPTKIGNNLHILAI
jgi:hypothetical protein